VLATVFGDVHDIGKNILPRFWNHGIRVIDLGKNVPKEIILDEAVKITRTYRAVGLMTTTTPRWTRYRRHARGSNTGGAGSAGYRNTRNRSARQASATRLRR
jgi:5-methyltetrahydrofolate--homocysteine methyltransferase